MKGSRLTVWWVVYVAKDYGMDTEQLAAHFQRPVIWVKAALNYYEAFPKEIDQAIEDHLATDFETLKRALPDAQLMEIPLEDAD